MSENTPQPFRDFISFFVPRCLSSLYRSDDVKQKNERQSEKGHSHATNLKNVSFKAHAIFLEANNLNCSSFLNDISFQGKFLNLAAEY